MRSTLTRTGQVTIPKPLREHLGLKPGASIEFELMPDGRICLRDAHKRPPSKQQVRKQPEPGVRAPARQPHR